MIVFFRSDNKAKNVTKRRYLILLFPIACWGGQFYILVAWLENSIALGCRAFNFALWRLKGCLGSSSGCGNDFCSRLLWRLKLNAVQLFGHYKSMISCSCQSQLDVTRCPVMLITWEIQQHHCFWCSAWFDVNAALAIFSRVNDLVWMHIVVVGLPELLFITP